MFNFPNLPREINQYIDSYVIADQMRDQKIRYVTVLNELIDLTVKIQSMIELCPIASQKQYYIHAPDDKHWHLGPRYMYKRPYAPSFEKIIHMTAFSKVFMDIEFEWFRKYLASLS